MEVTALEVANVRLLPTMNALVLYKMVALAECSCTAFEITSVGQLARVNPVVLRQFAWCLKRFAAPLPRTHVPSGRARAIHG